MTKRTWFFFGFSALLVGLSYCNNYGLDERIRNAINGGAGGLTFTNVQGGTYNGNTIGYTLSNATKFTASISYNGSTGGISVDMNSVPSFLNVAISSTGELQISTISKSSTLPTTLSSSNLNPSLRFILSSGSSISVPMTLSLKRAFVSSTVMTEDLAFSGTFTAGCTGSSIDKVNCGCQNRALAAGLPNAMKFRAWLSYDGASPVTAMCNITQKASASVNGIGAIMVTTPGSGYTSSPSIGISGGGGSCTGQTFVTTVQNGQLVDVTVTNPGSGCTTTPTTATVTGGGGTGALVISIRSGCNIKPGDGGPWFTTQSAAQLIAYDMGALNSGSLFHTSPLVSPINYTEFGNASNSTPYTGTTANGEYSPSNCAQWSTVGTGCGQIGSSNSIAANIPGWTMNNNGGIAATGQQNPFYCFEAD